jgi:hypothetical protein
VSQNARPARSPCVPKVPLYGTHNARTERRPERGGAPVQIGASGAGRRRRRPRTDRPLWVHFRLPPQVLRLTHCGGDGASSDRHPGPDEGVILRRRSGQLILLDETDATIICEGTEFGYGESLSGVEAAAMLRRLAANE